MTTVIESSRETPRYDPELTLLEARQRYFDLYGFDNGGYDDKWVVLKAGPIPLFCFPNIPARVVAVKYHDLHHVLTEYPANWVGEGEIGAWEVASGCKHHWPAWLLNLWAMAIGLALAPRKIYRAFMRGRRSDNLYALPFDEHLLGMSVDSARRMLRLHRPRAVSAADRLAFALWSIVGVAFLLSPYATLAALVLWLVTI